MFFHLPLGLCISWSRFIYIWLPSLLPEPILQSSKLSPSVKLIVWLHHSDNIWIWKDAYFFFPASCDLSLQFGDGLQGHPCTQCQCHCWSRGLVWSWLGRSWGQIAEWQDLWMCAVVHFGGEMWIWDTSLCGEMFALESSFCCIQQNVLPASQTLTSLLHWFMRIVLGFIPKSSLRIYINGTFILGKV